MLRYDTLSTEICEKILSDRKNGTVPSLAFDELKAKRRDGSRDTPCLIRTPFIRDIDKILHCPMYNRCSDKTQVFSFFKNDDITRRALHVQLVSRIARTLGKALCLNTDLIEAIALGHDIGHTPLGHAGERFLDELYFKHTKLHFAHNLHSVRVLDEILPMNLTLEVLSGIASHNGELELSEYSPRYIKDFDELYREIRLCEENPSHIKELVPSTLEGCVVRISDIIAYLGKDRQDAERAGLMENCEFEDSVIGTYNAEIINNLIVNIIENSYGKPYIKMSHEYFEALKKVKNANYRAIYQNKAVEGLINTEVAPMMSEMYERLLSDLLSEKQDSFIFTHHINFVNSSHYKRSEPYEKSEPNRMVVDYIASMTDDYFVDLYKTLFPESERHIPYRGYFD